MSQVLSEALERAKTAETARAELQRRINEELNPELDRLRAEKAEAETGKGKAEAATRMEQSKRATAEATATARQAAIDELTAERDTLSVRIEVLGQEIIRLDGIEQEKRRQVAVAMREEAEKADASKWQRLGTLIMGILCVIAFIILHLSGVKMTWMARGWIFAIVMGLSFFGPHIMRLMDKISPHAEKHWRKITIGVALAISGLISYLGRSDDSVWAVILLWIASFIGYGLLFQGFFESFRHLFKREDGTEMTWRDRLALGWGVSVIGGLILAGIYSAGKEVDAPIFLLHTLVGMAAMGCVFLIGTICFWLGSKVGANASGLFEKERRRLRQVDKWLRMCKTATVFVAVVVGWIVGSGYSYSNGVNTLSSWVMAVAIGFGVSTVYYLIEGKVLEACFLRKYHWVILILLVLGGAVFATGTAYLSFGKVYYEASRGPRFMETQSAVVAAESAYLAAAEPTCLRYVDKQEDVVNNPYAEALREMHEALEMANKATERDQLMESASKFQTGGAKASACLNFLDRNKNLLGKVVVYPEPTPSDLSSQFWFETVIEGTKVHEGSARQAMVAVFVLDFLIVILAIFGWLFASPQIKTDEDEAHTGRIISLLPGGRCVINLGSEKGVELDDVLNVVGERGDILGSLTVEDIERLGTGACVARVASDKMQVAPGLRVTLAS